MNASIHTGHCGFNADCQRPPQHSSHASSASGNVMAVSFTASASTKHSGVIT